MRMLHHLNHKDIMPSRVVVIGSEGFVGSAILKNLFNRGINTLGLARKDVDLLTASAGAEISKMLRPDDYVVMASAIAPVKNSKMLCDNITMVDALTDAIIRQPVAHILNISSDAIYSDTKGLLSESSCASPSSLHGIMHLCRELMLGDACVNIPLCFLRPTLIYGKNDPHNGYGPNQFRNLAEQRKDIVLFGEGEELRDHVYIGDVAELAARILLRKSFGSLNAATGKVVSFRDCAETIVSLYDGNSKIVSRNREIPMPHDGYRAFDSSLTKLSFPDFSYIEPVDGFIEVSKLG